MGASAGELGAETEREKKPLILVAMYPATVIAMFVVTSLNTTEDIGLQMSGAMTFFFRVIYIQYHINNLPRRS